MKNDKRYIIVSGYHDCPGDGLDWFHHVWWETNFKHVCPQRVFIVSSGNSRVPNGHGEWIRLSGNLGGCDEVMRLKGKRFMTGCAAVWMIGAWLAYANQTDFIYLEQDALIFGSWVEKLYSEIGERQMLTGRCNAMPASTTVFIVKCGYIPAFVYGFLQQGSGDVEGRLSEWKFRRMVDMWPEHCGFFSFGYDRDRPFNMKDEVWYAQKFTVDELRDLHNAGLITSINGMPQDVKRFTNHLR